MTATPVAKDCPSRREATPRPHWTDVCIWCYQTGRTCWHCDERPFAYTTAPYCLRCLAKLAWSYFHNDEGIPRAELAAELRSMRAAERAFRQWQGDEPSGPCDCGCSGIGGTIHHRSEG